MVTKRRICITSGQRPLKLVEPSEFQLPSLYYNHRNFAS
ncbi:hypothetical protein BOVA514_1765 [Bacteroides ovatus]|nr:hypothetical protein BOVA514_1765 [Bacteroides ovatus]